MWTFDILFNSGRSWNRHMNSDKNIPQLGSIYYVPEKICIGSTGQPLNSLYSLKCYRSTSRILYAVEFHRSTWVHRIVILWNCTVLASYTRMKRGPNRTFHSTVVRSLKSNNQLAGYHQIYLILAFDPWYSQREQKKILTAKPSHKSNCIAFLLSNSCSASQNKWELSWAGMHHKVNIIWISSTYQCRHEKWNEEVKSWEMERVFAPPAGLF